MDIHHSLMMFDALSQETRLRAFRLLVEAGPGGMAAGQLGEQLGAAHNTLSFHLSHLTNAGMVQSRKQGRSVIYSANFEAMQNLIEFLVKDCCRAEDTSFQRDRQSGCTTIELKRCC